MTSRRPRSFSVFLVLCLAVSSFALLQSLVIPVLPVIADAVDSDRATATWLVTAYLISASVFTPLAGRLGDAVGKQQVLLLTLLALAGGSLVAALSDDMGALITARAIQGIGGGVLPLTFGIIRDQFPPEKVTSAIATTSSLLAGSTGIGLIIAGPVVRALDYRWLFWIPLIMTIVAASVVCWLIPKSKPRMHQRVNWWTGVLMSVWMVALLVAVSEGDRWGWFSPRTVALFGVSAVVGVLWVIAEARSSVPLVDMELMKRPAVWRLNLVAFLFGSGMYGMFAFMPQFLQTPPSTGYGFGLSPSESGFALAPYTGASFLAGVAAGRLGQGYGSKPLLVLGTALSSVAILGLAVANNHLWLFVAQSIVLGLSVGLSFSTLAKLMVDAVPQAQTGLATGMNANIRTMGGAIGAAVMGSVITADLRPDSLPYAAGYVNGFSIFALASAVAVAVAISVPAGGGMAGSDRRR